MKSEEVRKICLAFARKSVILNEIQEYGGLYMAVKKRKWTDRTALAYMLRAVDDIVPRGLKYWSAYDYLNNYTSIKVPEEVMK